MHDVSSIGEKEKEKEKGQDANFSGYSIKKRNSILQQKNHLRFFVWQLVYRRVNSFITQLSKAIKIYF
jgi:hypothetical protein